MRIAKLYILPLLLIALPAYAASNPLASSGKHDTNQPIEINADQLEVFQEENRAVFSGNVVAIQGDVRLKSDKMNVFYKSGGNEKGKQPAQGGIQKIEVTGNVFLSTPQETASGEVGVYDVENQRIDLNNKVVLTRDKNVLKGDKLTYNFATGKSVITGGTQAAPEGGKKERVRALFIPEKGDKK